MAAVLLGVKSENWKDHIQILKNIDAFKFYKVAQMPAQHLKKLRQFFLNQEHWEADMKKKSLAASQLSAWLAACYVIRRSYGQEEE
jgi:hypothetical protein